MRVVVPFAADRPKTRLSDALPADERAAFARTMLADVLAAVRAAGREPTVLATASVDVDAPVTVDDRPLTEAVNAVLADADDPVAVVTADLAPEDRPGRGGGTNALVVRHLAFRVDYHGASYLDHLSAARAVDAAVAEFDSHRLATDVDEPADLAEVLLHGEGRAREWLREAGFRLVVDQGRVKVVRD